MSKKIVLEGLDHFKDQENAMIAGKPESTNTATVAHAVGEYFYWKGVLNIVTAAIAVGGTIQTNTNVKPAVLADDVSDLKESINKNLLEEDSFNHAWIQGAFNRISGASYNTTKAVRNNRLIKKATNTARVVANSGYKMSLWAWNEATDAFIGHVQANGEYGTDTTYTFFNVIDFDYSLGYYYRVCLYHEDTTIDTTPSDGINAVWYINKINKIMNNYSSIEQNTTLAKTPEFGTAISTIFTNNDSNAIAGVDDGLLNNVCVVKISDEMYYMYYGAYAVGESGYSNESTCFAYSTDGLTFTKGFPAGVTPPFTGSTRVMAKGAVHGACVVLVPDDDYPFRMCGVDGNDSSRVVKLWKSADGINWQFLKQITIGYNDSFPSCIVRGNTLKFYLRSRDSAKNRIIVTLITDLEGNHINIGAWNQAITLNDATKQLYIAAASKLDETRDLLIPTIYNPSDSSETVCFIVVDGGHMDVIYPDTSAIIDEDVKSIYFAPNIVGISFFTQGFYVTRSTDHEHFDATTVSSIKRVRVNDSTLTEIVRP